MSAALKLTNLTFVIPIALLCAYNALSVKTELKLKFVGLALFVLVAPLVPYSLYMYWQTGNPVFPFYNKIFQSPFFATNVPTDVNHGPQTFWEMLVWPIWAFFYPERISELSGYDLPYTGRVSLGFIVAALGVTYRSLDREVRVLCFATLMSSVMWSVMTGNVRYGLYLEAMAGITILCLLISLCASERSAGKLRPRQMLALVVLFGGLLATQMIVSYRVVYRYSQVLYNQPTQPHVFQNPGGYLTEARNFLRDRSLDDYLSPGDKEKFAQVEVWINSYYTTSGVEVMLKPDIPMLAVCNYVGDLNYLHNEATKRRLAETLRLVQGKRMFSLSRSTEGHLEGSKRFITEAGLTVGEITPVEVPYYSRRTRLHMYLIEVLPPATE